MSRVECDKARCSGCLVCIVACLDQHYDEADGYAVPARIYEMQKSGDSDLEIYVTRSCLHCEEAACLKVCRYGGCKLCLKACPYDVPRFDSEHKIVKCDGCSVRVAMGLEPACVRACNTGALKLV